MQAEPSINKPGLELGLHCIHLNVRGTLLEAVERGVERYLAAELNLYPCCLQWEMLLIFDVDILRVQVFPVLRGRNGVIILDVQYQSIIIMI